MSSGRRGHRQATHAVLFDQSRHQPCGLDILDEGAQILSARGATFRRAGGLLDRGEAAIEEARAGQGVLVRDEARPEPSEGVEPVLDETLEGVLAALFADELGVLQRAAQVELVGAPCWRGDADAGAVYVGDGLERRAGGTRYVASIST